MVPEAGAKVDWLLAGPAEEGHSAGPSPEGGVVEAGAVLVGAFGAVAIERNIDQGRGWSSGEFFVGQVEGFLAAGDQVGHEDIGFRGELVYGLDCLGTGEIEGNRTLTPVIELEGVADGESLAEIGVPDLCAESVALQGFHFDNVGAHVGHHGAAQEGMASQLATSRTRIPLRGASM